MTTSRKLAACLERLDETSKRLAEMKAGAAACALKDQAILFAALMCEVSAVAEILKTIKAKEES